MMTDYDVEARTSADVPNFARTMAATLCAGREFAIWVETTAGDERLAYTIRRDGGAYRIRNADLSDIGTFSDIGVALRHGQKIVDHLEDRA